MVDDQITNSTSLPVIDLREFEDDSCSAKAYKKLRETCEVWGCFRMINHTIPLELMSEMKAVVQSLLDLPAEIKNQNTNNTIGRGYVAPSAGMPLYEALGLYDFGSTKAVRSFCDQLDASPHQREIIENYAGAIHELIKDIQQKLAKSMGLKTHTFEGHWPCQFKIIKYSFNPQHMGSSGVPSHTDNGFLTILQDDENVGGLEVMNKNGEFLPVDPWPGTFLVNLGDVAKAWSNGRLCNVLHRVLCKEATTRICIASFLLGPKDEVVEAPKEFVDGEHPRLYAPFNHDDYWKERLSKNLRAGEVLEQLRFDK